MNRLTVADQNTSAGQFRIDDLLHGRSAGSGFGAACGDIRAFSHSAVHSRADTCRYTGNGLLEYPRVLRADHLTYPSARHAHLRGDRLYGQKFPARTGRVLPELTSSPFHATSDNSKLPPASRLSGTKTALSTTKRPTGSLKRAHTSTSYMKP